MQGELYAFAIMGIATGVIVALVEFWLHVIRGPEPRDISVWGDVVELPREAKVGAKINGGGGNAPSDGRRPSETTHLHFSPDIARRETSL